MSPRLKQLAYRMLGSVADAEDVLQEAALRLHRCDPRPDSEEAFLFRVVTNLCLDQLRRDKVRRQHYSGPWLPDPLPDETDDDGFALTDLAEQLSIGFMLMLERLTPAERVVYVLREGFDFNYAEIAAMLEISAANARQRASRARARLQQPPTSEPSTETRPGRKKAAQKAMLTALIEAIAQADIESLVSLMSDDAIVLTDGGGVVSAAIRPIHGNRRIAQVILHLVNKVRTQGEATFEFTPMNGGWGLVIRLDGEVHSVNQVELKNGKLHRLYVTRNPHKLAHLR